MLCWFWCWKVVLCFCLGVLFFCGWVFVLLLLLFFCLDIVVGLLFVSGSCCFYLLLICLLLVIYCLRILVMWLVLFMVSFCRNLSFILRLEFCEGRLLLLGSDGRLMFLCFFFGIVIYGLLIVFGFGVIIGVCIVVRCFIIGCIIKNSNNSVSRL